MRNLIMFSFICMYVVYIRFDKPSAHSAPAADIYKQTNNSEQVWRSKRRDREPDATESASESVYCDVCMYLCFSVCVCSFCTAHTAEWVRVRARASERDASKKWGNPVVNWLRQHEINEIWAGLFSWKIERQEFYIGNWATTYVCTFHICMYIRTLATPTAVGPMRKSRYYYSHRVRTMSQKIN